MNSRALATNRARGRDAELAEHRFFRRTARAPFRNQQARGERNDERRNLRHQSVAHRQFGEDVGRRRDVQAVAADPDHDPAEDIDREDDQTRDGVAAHEFRRAVHRAEERAFLFQLATAALRFLFIDQPGRKVGVDRHLLARNRVEGEAGADFRDTGRALGDDEKIDGDQDDEDDEANDEIAVHHQPGKAADDIAGRGHALRAMTEDQACRRDFQRQAQQGGDE